MSHSESGRGCPFCGIKTDDEYAILLHIEENHAEGKSPFIADVNINAVPAVGHYTHDREEETNEEDQFADCPVEGCLERIALVELEDHINFHAIEEHEESPTPATPASSSSPDGEGEYRSPYAHNENTHRRNEHDRRARDHSVIDAWKEIFKRPPPSKPTKIPKVPGTRRRLGKSELGRFAHEEQMPDWLVDLLVKGKYKSSEGIVPVLGKLLEHSTTTEHAWLCHPAVHHVSKLPREGGFCGYRNIQMLSSYLIGANITGAEDIGHEIPSIFQIQDYIETAWDMGINASGRIETGGVRGTRKYIGTPEAQAMFTALQIPCEAQGFKSPQKGVAEANLFLAIQKYFQSAPYDPIDKVRYTDLPPIYFQHRGHSLTIVGLERLKTGALELLVFDPMFHDPKGVTRLVGEKGTMHGGGKDNNKWFLHRDPDNALNLYRRGNKYLKKYHEFEILKLRTNPA
ncbi:peptidase family C78-domain-containing protein [Xylariaceae sp. FL1019]|nr:peptidase family C78-domain-containing protein [Xylariaceae sp. FL1019]